MKSKEEILKPKWTKNHYANEALEMRGIILYSESKCLEAMQEFTDQETTFLTKELYKADELAKEHDSIMEMFNEKQKELQEENEKLRKHIADQKELLELKTLNNNRLSNKIKGYEEGIEFYQLRLEALFRSTMFGKGIEVPFKDWMIEADEKLNNLLKTK